MIKIILASNPDNKCNKYLMNTFLKKNQWIRYWKIKLGIWYLGNFLNLSDITEKW